MHICFLMSNSYKKSWTISSDCVCQRQSCFNKWLSCEPRYYCVWFWRLSKVLYKNQYIHIRYLFVLDSRNSNCCVIRMNFLSENARFEFQTFEGIYDCTSDFHLCVSQAFLCLILKVVKFYSQFWFETIHDILNLANHHGGL